MSSSTINNISLFIPRVFANYTRDDVSDVFAALNIGKVKSVDFVSKLSNQNVEYNAVYIHFECWYNNDYAVKFQKQVIDPNQEARVTCDKHWFWIVLENKAKKFISSDRKPRIDLGELVVKPVVDVAIPCVLPIAPCMPTFKQVVENAPKKKYVKIECEMKQHEVMEYEEMDADELEMEAAMDEMEIAMEENEYHLITIDGRYVSAMEQENVYMRMEMAYLRATLIHVDMMYQAEVIKARTFAELEASIPQTESPLELMEAGLMAAEDKKNKQEHSQN